MNTNLSTTVIYNISTSKTKLQNFLESYEHLIRNKDFILNLKSIIKENLSFKNNYEDIFSLNIDYTNIKKEII